MACVDGVASTTACTASMNAVGREAAQGIVTRSFRSCAQVRLLYSDTGGCSGALACASLVVVEFADCAADCAAADDADANAAFSFFLSLCPL